jgi:alkanesulfonate monooxygenase SsuD/methylene tetrahydromethanopterin reductase-like flavin-dependent oxidoreductase (luciferase family)
MRNVGVNVSFGMRWPDWVTPTQELYRTAIEMSAFCDRIGVDQIGFMQHHGSEDGYLPQPFTLAAGIATVTEKVRFLLGAVVLPLHDPVEIAEQIAFVDLTSNGRLNVILLAGYVPSDFKMFGKSLRNRAKLMDAAVKIILRSLRSERFEYERRPIIVRPLPVQKREEFVMIGGAFPPQRNEPPVSASGWRR